MQPEQKTGGWISAATKGGWIAGTLYGVVVAVIALLLQGHPVLGVDGWRVVPVALVVIPLVMAWWTSGRLGIDRGPARGAVIGAVGGALLGGYVTLMLRVMTLDFGTE